jgi:thioredoxin reductase (NADPH)
VVIDDEQVWLHRLQRALSRRLAADYDIVVEQSASVALDTLQALREAGTPVALILADQSMVEMTGIDLLAAATDIQPDAERAVMIAYGELETAREPILRAASLGHIQTYVAKPWRDSDEPFYHAISKFLEDWDRGHRPQFELIRIVGDRWDAYSVALRDALHRSGVPYGFYAPDSEEGGKLLRRTGITGPLPVAVFFDGRVVARPTAMDIASAMGVNVDAAGAEFDLVVVGAGPAGLSAAVYGASEGLRTLVVESEALGGQASTSSMIRNYLGFPRGLSGADLAGRAYRQAWFFGASFLIGRVTTALRQEAERHVVVFDDGSEVRSRAVVLATGVSYRRLRVGRLEEFVGRGVFYGAPVSEVPGMADQRVVVVGGGNSSAQMALYLARYATHVTVVTRDPELNQMSDYLVRDIRSRRNIETRLNSVVVDVRGENRLQALVLRDTVRDTTEEFETSAAFILIGAEPRTAWLPSEIVRDDRGYVLTGGAVRPDGAVAAGSALRAPLETSLPGVFAVGDVRLGSMKRIAAAVGEGSSVVRMVHEHLARAGAAQPT